jgi:tagaturonate reductase
MKLSATILQKIDSGKVIVPNEELLKIPEKVLQFGTGILLRGLPDYFIDKANRKGIFNGRVVMVKSTNRGDASSFGKQDGLFTLCVRGVQDGQAIEENIINSSISRLLSANTEWPEILKCAHNPDIGIIISNTTEVGISLVKEDINLQPPVSYPGKLLAFLYERFKAFGGSQQSGCIIIPTELIPGNGNKLQSIVIELANFNKLPAKFITWIGDSNHFCNSLVDRIVIGIPEERIKKLIESELGYEDDLMTVCEVYRLWAIEGNAAVKEKLSFSKADEGVKIEPDIELYRELKLRILNGTHTLSCGVAFLTGIDTVREAMEDEVMGKYIADLMNNEIGISLPIPVESNTINNYISLVRDRFRNPHINHYWKTITLNYTSKIRLRCIPLLLNYYRKTGEIPELFSLGFSAYLFFMKADKKIDDGYYGIFNGQPYLIDDEKAGKYYDLWQKYPVQELVHKVLKDETSWGEDLSGIAGFYDSVVDKLNSIINVGMKATLQNINTKKMYNES